jgi:hypothetical protein
MGQLTSCTQNKTNNKYQSLPHTTRANSLKIDYTSKTQEKNTGEKA